MTPRGIEVLLLSFLTLILVARCAPKGDDSNLANKDKGAIAVASAKSAPLACKIDNDTFSSEPRYKDAKFVLASEATACNSEVGGQMLLAMDLDLSPVFANANSESQLLKLDSCFLRTNVPKGNSKMYLVENKSIANDSNTHKCAHTFSLPKETPLGDYEAAINFTYKNSADEEVVFRASFGIRIGNKAADKPGSSGTGSSPGAAGGLPIDPARLCSAELPRGGTKVSENSAAAVTACASRIEGISTCDSGRSGHLFACQDSGWDEATSYLKCKIACFRCPLGTPDICLDDANKVEALLKDPEQVGNILIISADSGSAVPPVTPPDPTEVGGGGQEQGAGQNPPPRRPTTLQLLTGCFMRS